MYTPRQFEETRIDVLHRLMKAHPLAALVTLGDSGLLVNHVPFLIDDTEGQFGTLKAHIPRANPVWRQLSDSVEAVAIFQGPESYITPSWYPSKHADGKAVPTWNYAVVHAHGHPRVIEDAQWLLNHLTELTDEHEADQALPWRVSDAPRDYTDRLIEALVGIEIPISRIFGKWKVSQNRSRSDRLGVAAGLESRADERSREMAELVMQHTLRSSS
ncbi:MAG TPA: FMN-binding negative transcriptional regulator [Noviherbaspirillum sp.]|nr:FMN-binding negative transcriptional regulator [Noviherbaspirillum sp.]